MERVLWFPDLKTMSLNSTSPHSGQLGGGGGSLISYAASWGTAPSSLYWNICSTAFMLFCWDSQSTVRRDINLTYLNISCLPLLLVSTLIIGSYRICTTKSHTIPSESIIMVSMAYMKTNPIWAGDTPLTPNMALLSGQYLWLNARYVLCTSKICRVLESIWDYPFWCLTIVDWLNLEVTNFGCGETTKTIHTGNQIQCRILMINKTGVLCDESRWFPVGMNGCETWKGFQKMRI
jgi:hypothetical protein